MIHREVDGVPALFVEAPGPVRAGLMFRVGRADEHLALAGITHLVEHLALHRHGDLDHHANGSVSDTVTHFHTAGTAADVVAFFETLCASLADLPMERLDTEKEILRTEEAGRGRGVNGNLPPWRYGAQGYGLVSYPEFGLHRVTADDLRQWTADRFTRDNAVLWIAGPQVPAELRLRLPAGARHPVPPPTSALSTTPAYFHATADGIVMDTEVTRCPAAALFAAILERALYRMLRLDSGISYTATTSYQPRGDGMAIITAYADALSEKRAAALSGFVDTIKELAKSGVAAEELEAVRNKALDALNHPDVATARLPAVAVDLLTGEPVLTVAEQADRLRAVTTADLLAIAGEVHANALLQVPYGVSAYTTGFAPAPTASDAAVSGQRYPSRGDDGGTLIVGEDGVSIIDDAGEIATVRFADCAVRLRWPDGGSQLIGNDGVTVSVEPTLHQLDEAALNSLDQAVPEGRTVTMPERSAEQIPRAAARHDPLSRTARKVEFAILAPLTVVLIVGFIVMANAWQPEDGELAEQLLLLMMLLGAVGLIRVLLLGFNRLRLGRW